MNGWMDDMCKYLPRLMWFIHSSCWSAITLYTNNRLFVLWYDVWCDVLFHVWYVISRLSTTTFISLNITHMYNQSFNWLIYQFIYHRSCVQRIHDHSSMNEHEFYAIWYRRCWVPISDRLWLLMWYMIRVIIPVCFFYQNLIEEIIQ